MVRFWDTSAIIPLLVEEQTSEAIESEHARESDLAVWWGTAIECESAMARRERDGARVDQGRDRLDLLAAAWREVAPSAELRQRARRLTRVHPLRAADALQLAAALTIADGDPGSLVVVTYDARLAEAARKEGFRVVSPGLVAAE